MKKWIANYDNNEIRIENSFNGERLFVNGKLQDEKFSLFSSDLTGHIMANNGEKKLIKLNLGGSWKVSCRLFINDEKINTAKNLTE